MRRHPHWETRLMAFAERVRGQRFEWGRWDCVLLAFRAIDCMLSRPELGLTPRWLGRWHTRAEALAAARETTLEDELLAAGAEPRSPRFARPGDVLVITGRRVPFASVYLGRHQLGATPRTGVELFTVGNVRMRDDVLALGVG